MLEKETLGLLFLVFMLVLMFLKVPLAFAFGLSALVGLIFVENIQTAVNVFAFMPYSHSTGFLLACLPMFILLGLLIGESTVGPGLYAAAYKWLGKLPGSLAVASLLAIALFSAISGSALASLATFAPIAYPQMRKYNYDKGLATGAICVGATMDIMIPPSTAMIFYAMLTDASIGQMFMAGFIPGAIEFILFTAVIFIMVKMKPSIAPPSADVFTMREKVASLKDVVPILLIFMLMFGGMYAGIFTPTEAGAIGSICTFVVVVAMRALKNPWRGLYNALKQTVKTSGTVIIILFSVMIFNTFIASSGIASALSEWIIHIGLNQIMFLLIVFFIYIILGALMDEISMIVLTVPLYLPALSVLNIDIIWFGILIILAWQLGMVLPPVGMMAFVTQNILKDPSIGTVYRGCLPFAAVLVVVEALIIVFPQIALFLPSIMVGK